MTGDEAKAIGGPGVDAGARLKGDEVEAIGDAGVDAVRFRDILGSFATGVSVMTTIVGDQPHGMTANAVSSVSLEPPLVLVCVARDALMASRVVDAGVFALSFLAADQAAVSTWFADPRRPRGAAEFTSVDTRVETTGALILSGNVGWVDCRVWSIADGGDHVIVLGEVLALGSDTDRPLLYYRGAYGDLVLDTPPAEPTVDAQPPGTPAQ